MKEMGLRQIDVAATLGVSQATVSAWLNGKIPTKEQFRDLASVLAAPQEWLEHGTGTPPIPTYPRPFRIAPQIETWKKLNETEQKAEVAAQLERAKEGFPARLKWLRQVLKLSLSQFAERSGYDRSYISRLENAERVNPSNEFVERLMEAFSLNRDWLLYGMDEPFKGSVTPSVAQAQLTMQKEIDALQVDLTLRKAVEVIFQTKQIQSTKSMAAYIVVLLESAEAEDDADKKITALKMAQSAAHILEEALAKEVSHYNSFRRDGRGESPVTGQ